MRPGQQNKRGRGRNNNNGNRKPSNPLSRSYDSTGPDVKVRGNASTIAEKYMALARDSQSSGDRVMAENYLQHAEHYNRIVAQGQAQMQERQQRDEAAREQQEKAQEKANEAAGVSDANAPVEGAGNEPASEASSSDGEENAPRRTQNRRRNNPRQRRPRTTDAVDGNVEASANSGDDQPVEKAENPVSDATVEVQVEKPVVDAVTPAE